MTMKKKTANEQELDMKEDSNSNFGSWIKLPVIVINQYENFAENWGVKPIKLVSMANLLNF
eukprot:CAMPEP_0170121288 /NCGR_PEP_ID=MMETSP0020_2-20130122/15771_1 /TAXON_ID=98059 /ORGANISM="Dinobryon sp., Strain UTEXLB2267" /LENGTH=60 /DNA_ID=CAMNT_0010351559 /DNA_START=29 /DNA_END=208 /DNA_ORIENTATION=-